ncbi:MAG: GDSL-type esterase/lipase family protein [Ilumatobacteraceae bacterium]
MVRRVVALGIVLLLGYAAVTGVSSLFGGESAATAPSTPITQIVINDGTPTTLGTLPPTTTTQPPVKPKTTPTKDDPAEVLILGDSDAGSFGPYLKTLLDQTGIATTELDYKTSSGLARPDFFDWPAHMGEVVPQVNPDIVVVTFGGNDAQGLRNLDKTWAVDHAPASGADDADWKAEYGKRVGAVMDYLTEGNRTLVWVGIPNDDNPDVTARMQVQDEVVRAEVAKRKDKVAFVDTWARFSGRNDGWAEYVIDPRDGEGKDVRADDGFHLNTTGAEILALDIAEAVKTDLRARGAAI